MRTVARILACSTWFTVALGAAVSCSDGGSKGEDQESGTGGLATTTGGSSGAGTGEEPLPACEGFEALADCGERTESARFRTPNILLVIDKSGSMASPIDPNATTPVAKWDGLKTALGAALANIDADMGIGLLLYPHNPAAPITDDEEDPAAACYLSDSTAAINVPMTRGAPGVASVLAALETTAPGGGTPTAAALEQAYQYYTVGAGAGLTGEKFVLLATDGGPNCNFALTCAGATCTTNIDGICPLDNCCMDSGHRCLDDAAVSEKISALRSAGVDTFVVGIPGTELYAQYLNRFASQGGRPSPRGLTAYYAATAEGGVDGLTAVFRDISTQLVRSCAIPLSRDPADRNLVNVAVDCILVPQSLGATSAGGAGGSAGTPGGGGGSSGAGAAPPASAEAGRAGNDASGDERGGAGGAAPPPPTQNNWHIDYTSSPATLILEGDLCTRVQTEGATRVDVVLGCPPYS